VTNGATWTNSGNITVGDSGSGTLTIASSGSVTANALFLANASNATGVLNIGTFGGNDTAGTLNLNGASKSITFGSGYGAINFNQNNSTTFSANISGAGVLNQLGMGTTILTGYNGYTKGTLITNGTLQVGNGGTNGTLGYGAVTNIATLTFNRSDYAVVANDISGTGAVTQIGAGTLAIVGNNSYTGVTTVSAGALSVGNGDSAGNLGSGDVVINTNASLILNRSDALTLQNAVSGNGSLVVLGGSTATILGSNTYKGTTLVDNTTLQVGINGTNGTLGRGTVLLTNYATLLYNLAGNNTLTNDVSGQGYLEIQGSGTTTLIGSNSYSEYTQVGVRSALQVGGGGSSGTLGYGSVYNYGDLIFNRNDLVIVSNNISGFGSLAQIGGGILLLNANNGYSGRTMVSGGKLSLGGTGLLTGGGAITVSNGGTLLLGAANQVSTNSALSLGSTGTSGTLSMGGNGTTRASTQTFNTLTLSANSSIDFANLSGQSALYFSKIGGLSNYTLSIFNYNGTNLRGTTSTTGGVGQYTTLYAKAGAGLSGFTDPELNNIKFYSGSNTNSLFLGSGSFSSNISNGFNQIVPVPEPGVVLAGLLLLGWMIYTARPRLVKEARTLHITLGSTKYSIRLNA
jgi:autotransporter-associated beta strand protein